MKADDIAHTLEQVPVIDVHRLIHSPDGLGVDGSEGWGRQHAVEVAQDGLALVEAETAVLQHRHPAKGMAGQMLRRAEGARRHRRKAIGRAFLFQRGQDGSSKWTAGNGMDDEFGHNDLLHLTMGVCVLTISARWAGYPLPNLSGSVE